LATFAVYCDVPDFLANGAANVETASLVGGNTVLSGAVTAGATTLPVTSVAGFPATGTFVAYILDGLNSERVIASVSGSALNIAAGIVVAHAAGISVSSAGTGGCLADAIIRASRSVENYCRQGPDGGADRTLYAVSRTEVATGPSLRVTFDVDYTLVIHPWRWPIQSLSSVSVQFGADQAIQLAMAPLFIPTEQRYVEIPYQTANPSPVTYTIQGRRGDSFVATWTYVAGACLTASLTSVPDDLRTACYLLVADILAQRQNPYGLSEVQQGKLHRVMRLRGDEWTSLFRQRAYELLVPYTA
jgi:hypothetical protein